MTDLHFSPPDGRSTRKKAVIRVSCLVIRENQGRGPSSLQKKCLMAGEPERPCFVTRGVKEAIWQVRLHAPFSSARLAPRPDGPLTHFTSPRGETCRLTEVQNVTSRGDGGPHHGRNRNAGRKPGRLFCSVDVDAKRNRQRNSLIAELRDFWCACVFVDWRKLVGVEPTFAAERQTTVLKTAPGTGRV